MENFQKPSEENEIAYAKLTRYEACHGCKAFIEDNAYPFCNVKIPYKTNGLICPCSVCLIKTICGELCTEFDVYLKNLYLNENIIENQEW